MADTTVYAGVNSDGTLAVNSGTSSVSTKPNGSLDKDAFLQLLVAQMKYQDPLEPSSNTDYVAQLATFSQVEELQNVSNSMSQTQANNLIGQIVVMKTTTSTGASAFIGGKVERVVMQAGKVYLGVNGNLYNIDDLDSIVDEDFYNKYYTDGTQNSDKTEGGDSTEDNGSTEDSDKTEQTA